jgi:hypothetical protein
MDSVVAFHGSIYEKGYGFIAREVMRDKNLKPQSKAIYAYICSFASNGNSGEKFAFPSVSLQCAELGFSEDTYYKYRKPLEDKGFIRIEKSDREAGKFSKNIYYICLVPMPLEPIPQNLGYGKNVDVEPFEPHPKNSGTVQPYPKSSSTVNPSPVNSGTKKTSLKKNSLKKNKFSLARLEDINSVDKFLKSIFPEVPFDDIKNQMIEEAKQEGSSILIDTKNRYQGLLNSRIEDWIRSKRPNRPFKRSNSPVRKEILPDWFDEENEAPESSESDRELTDEQKKAEIEEILKEFRNK